MARAKRHSAEEIVNKLRQAEVEFAKGATIAHACKQIGVTDQTYYKWRREYGGLKVTQAKKLKELEKENVRLKKLVADLALDKAMLQEVASGNF
jgi:transposase-like protein